MLVDAMASAARCESRAVAERLATVAALYRIRKQTYIDAGLWRTDVFEAVAAEVSAAQNISRWRAGSQVRMAVSLYERLPEVAAVFYRGDIDLRMVQLALARTDNVDDSIIADLDAALAERVVKWMRFSDKKLKDRLDQWVARFDRAGVRVPPAAKDNRYFDVTPDVPGMAFAGGVLNATDAAALDQRLEAMADTLCANDPRTRNQRRADAAGALGRGESTLTCQCGSGDCPAAALRESAAKVVIHILAEQATVEGTSGDPGYLSGFGILPADEVRAAAKTASSLRYRSPVPNPRRVTVRRQSCEIICGGVT